VTRGSPCGVFPTRGGGSRALGLPSPWVGVKGIDFRRRGGATLYAAILAALLAFAAPAIAQGPPPPTARIAPSIAGIA
jgi:hypothetical protein